MMHINASRYKTMWNNNTLKTLLFVSRSLLELYIYLDFRTTTVYIYFFFYRLPLNQLYFPTVFLLQNDVRKSFKFLLLETKAELLGKGKETTRISHRNQFDK